MSILAISIQHITESLSLSNWETEVSKCQPNCKWKIKRAYIWRTYDLIIVILDKEDEGRNVILSDLKIVYEAVVNKIVWY